MAASSGKQIGRDGSGPVRFCRRGSRRQRVVDRLPVSSGIDEVFVTQHGEMLRQRRLTECEGLVELAYCALRDLAGSILQLSGVDVPD